MENDLPTNDGEIPAKPKPLTIAALKEQLALDPLLIELQAQYVHMQEDWRMKTEWKMKDLAVYRAEIYRMMTERQRLHWSIEKLRAKIKSGKVPKMKPLPMLRLERRMRVREGQVKRLIHKAEMYAHSLAVHQALK